MKMKTLDEHNKERMEMMEQDKYDSWGSAGVSCPSCKQKEMVYKNLNVLHPTKVYRSRIVICPECECTGNKII